MRWKQKLCAMNTHYRFYELSQFFAYVHQQDIHYVELWTGPMHFSVMDHQQEDIQTIVQLANQYAIEIIGICPEQTNPKPYNIAGKHRIEAIYQYFVRVLTVAYAMGCSQVVLTSGWAYYNEPIEAAWHRSIQMMRRICSYAHTYQIQIALEALQYEESRLVNSIADIVRYRQAVNMDNLKVCIDFGAMARANDTLRNYFEVFKTDICHIHFVDGNPVGHLAWGDGNRNLKEDLAILCEYNYPGYLSLETATSRYYETPWDAEKKTIRAFDNKVIKEV